jgi:hypothetical protein
VRAEDADLMTDLDFHRNFMANSGWRNPLLKNKRSRFVSNLMYNAGRYFMQMAGGSETDAISNHYVQKEPNPAAGVHEFDAIPVTQDSRYPTGTASIHLSGNVGPSNPTGALDNWAAMARAIRHENAENKGAGETLLDARYRRDQPLAPVGVPISVVPAIPAGSLAAALLPTVGCSARLDPDGKWVPVRDAADERVIAEFRSRTQGMVPATETEVGGYPRIKGGAQYPDANHNGMSDQWEARHRVSGHAADADGDGYTNLEEFLNGTDPNRAEQVRDL